MKHDGDEAADRKGRIAITRAVSPGINRCELTHLGREEIDIELARRQHQAYEQLLERLGCRMVRLPVEPDLPDSVFVEDAAVVLDELAIVCRPGAASRRAETESVAAALAPYRELARVVPPGTIDGGDVLRVDRKLFVGLSTRTNGAAVGQLEAFLGPFGYEVVPVRVEGCLHLKSAVTEVAPGVLLVNRSWVEAGYFPGLQLIDVDPREPFGANALRVDGTVVYPTSFPRTRERLEARGIEVAVVDLSELAKAEGAVTCCSLIVEP
jgi:dimethylargininase